MTDLISVGDTNLTKQYKLVDLQLVQSLQVCDFAAFHEFHDENSPCTHGWDCKWDDNINACLHHVVSHFSHVLKLILKVHFPKALRFNETRR